MPEKSSGGKGFDRRSLLGLAGMSADELTDLLDRAESFLGAASRPAGGDSPPPVARGLSAANLFLEPSTRTRCSFEIAESRLGVERVSIEGRRMSLEKGETLVDTCRVLAAMGVNVIVLRHPEGGAAAMLDEGLAASGGSDRGSAAGVRVINAGDGANEHPTQGLLDLFTLRQFWGEIEGRRIVMVGDVTHSRVVRSNYHGLITLGAEVVLCGPQEFLPSPESYPEATLSDDLDAALAGADAVMALRIQRERLSVGEDLPDAEVYRRNYGLTADRAAALPEGVPVLHPGPVNRGIEVDGEVADGLRSLILRQVTAGVAVRMAVLSAMGKG